MSYQYPAIVDDNWLMIWMRVDSPKGSWSCIEPMLEARDLPRIAEWLESIAAGRPVRRGLGFIEPNLEFHLVKRRANGAKLWVAFEQEARPPWVLGRTSMPGEEPFITLELSHGELREAAASMRAEAAEWPWRVPINE